MGQTAGMSTGTSGDSGPSSLKADIERRRTNEVCCYVIAYGPESCIVDPGEDGLSVKRGRMSPLTIDEMGYVNIHEALLTLGPIDGDCFVNRHGFDELPEMLNAGSEGLKGDGISLAGVKGPTRMWRQEVTQNVYGSAMCGSEWCCTIDHGDTLIEALVDSRVSTLMADASPGNEGGRNVCDAVCAMLCDLCTV